ncbi:hypothetical protein LO762_23680 [Actinocorallia sp. API 0066]|uniref:hypothetical protein n=1 Tax=Actinocorallia sp. API 0066 TaxID=2896846 RepID=UPI001E3FBCAC|nr:hypothetical protein [Actinocorallia sp. API 0066]MCD0452169.1 hypothetical protein [Actinocorallia sp. API 0066]
MFPPGAQGPQGPRRSRKPLLALLSAVGALVVVLAVVALVVATGGDDRPKVATPQEKLAQAADAIGKAKGLRYTGDFTSDTLPVQADLSVTHAGTASGTLTIRGQVMDMMLLDGDMYVKANKAFWLTQPGITEGVAPDYADKWAKAPLALRGFDIRALLTPAALGQAVGQATPAVVPTGQPATQDVGGRPALTFEGANNQYLVTNIAPYEVLQIRAGGEDSFAFTVAALDAGQMDTLYSGLTQKVKNELVGALDPASTVSYVNKATSTNCSVSGCTIRRTLSNTGAAAWVKYHAAIWKQREGGTELGTCTRTVKLGKGTRTLECRISSSGWSSWVRAIPPGTKSTYYFQGWVKVESVSGARAATFASQIEKERTS